MKKKSPFSIAKRIQSFKYAVQGIFTAFKTEHNLWIHSLCAVVVIILGFIFSINRFEWIAISFAIALVFITELINSAFEYLCDVVEPSQNEKIKHCKDIAAGAVLIAAIVALTVGGIVFIPYLN